MKRIAVCTHARKLAIAAVFPFLFGLAGCNTGNGPGNEALAPPANTDGLAKTADTVAPTTATGGDDYNEQMRKQQQERQKKGSQYPGKK